MTGEVDLDIYDAVVLYFRAGAAVLARTLDALTSQSAPPRLIIVVDNASGDGVVTALKVDSRLKTLVLPENRGYAGGMNAGRELSPSGTDHLLFLTHETELLPGSAAALLDASMMTQSAVAGPRLLRRRDMSTWSVGGSVLPSGGVQHRLAAPLHEANPVDVDWLDGAALLVSAAATSGGPIFDERFFLYWEDVEMCLRLRQFGRVVNVPAAAAVQETGLTPPYYGARNRILLWRSRRDAKRALIGVVVELRRATREFARGRLLDAVGRVCGVADGVTGSLHLSAAGWRSNDALYAGLLHAGVPSPERGRVVSFSLVVPFEGIPHAGGEYALRHLRALLASGWHVTIVAPAFPQSVAALASLDPRVDVALVPVRGLERRFGVGGRLRKTRLTRLYRRRVLRSKAVQRAVQQADLLEFQWTEMATLALDFASRGVPAVAVAHDVITQSLERFAGLKGAPLHLRILRRFRLIVGRRDESRVLAAVDSVVVFSGKDEAKLRSIGVQTPIEVVPPSLQPLDPRWRDPRSPLEDNVLMVAAFNRKENVGGFLWFLENVWPLVKTERPGARLRVVGAEPSSEMVERAAAAPDVIVAGYVSDLVPEYQQASVAVVPLQVGAGVKFKTVTAMMWGVPVVTTEVGAEGIADAQEADRLFVAVTDLPSEFAAAVVRALDGEHDTAEPARRHVEQRFGAASFDARINLIYARLVHVDG